MCNVKTEQISCYLCSTCSSYALLLIYLKSAMMWQRVEEKCICECVVDVGDVKDVKCVDSNPQTCSDFWQI